MIEPNIRWRVLVSLIVEKNTVFLKQRSENPVTIGSVAPLNFLHSTPNKKVGISKGATKMVCIHCFLQPNMKDVLKYTVQNLVL